MGMTRGPAPGTVVAGRFTLTICLGTGGMGTIWEALDASGESFALKFLRPKASIDARSQKRFLREARIVRTLTHPAVARTFDLIEFEGAPVIVMELCIGQSLRCYLARSAPLAAVQVAGFLLPLTDALQYCHDQGIVHRDIKPENIFVTAPGTPDLGVKLLDFGYAKLRANEAGAAGSVVTEVGTKIGTPWYMAPEQIIAPELVDERTDIWSLGVVAYEALTGCLPFEGSSPDDVMRRILHDAFVPLELLAPEAPADLVRIIERALARSPELRPAGMRELSTVFQAYTQPSARK